MTKASATRAIRKLNKDQAIKSLDHMIEQITKIMLDTNNIPEGKGVPGKWVSDNFKIVVNEIRRVRALIE